jgi:hypothetical protein
VEILIPTPQQDLSMVFNQLLYPANLGATETSAGLDADGIQPELCHVFVAFDMDMRRLIAIRRVEEAAIGPGAKRGRHSQTAKAS